MTNNAKIRLIIYKKINNTIWALKNDTENDQLEIEKQGKSN